MTKNVPTKILRIEQNFFVNLRKKMFLAAHAAPRRRRRQFFWTGGAPPPPPAIDRRATAHTPTAAHRPRVTPINNRKARPTKCHAHQGTNTEKQMQLKRQIETN